MNEINSYQNRKVVRMDYSKLLDGKMPKSNWICLVTSSESKPDLDKFDRFSGDAFKNGILEFKGHGKFGELLHDWFDETMVIMETMKNYS